MAKKLDGRLDGIVRIQNPVWERNYSSGLSVENYHVQGPKIQIQSPTVIENNERYSSDIKAASAYVLSRESSATETYQMGNVDIINPSCRDLRDTKQIQRMFYIRNGQPNPSVDDFDKVRIIDPLEDGAILPYWYISGKVDITDQLDLLTIVDTFVGTIDPGEHNYSSHRIADNRGGIIIYALRSLKEGFPPITFEARGDREVRIVPPSGGIIRPLAQRGQRIESTQVGDKITLKPNGDGEWFVVNSVGSWRAVNN